MDVEIRGTILHVEMSDPEKGDGRPPLVLIHGAGGDAAMWEFQDRRFAEDRRVLRLELPAHGGSGGTGEKEIRAYSRWVLEVIHEVLGRIPCVLMGHSMGGAIAMDMAVSGSLPLAGLVLVGTGAKLGVAPVVFRLLREDFEGFLKTIDGAALGGSAPPEVRERVAASLRRSSPETTHGDFTACDRFDLRERLKDILLPTLVICGEEDLLTPMRYSEYLHREIAGSRLVRVPEAGHMVMLEDPETVNEAVGRFLAEKTDVSFQPGPLHEKGA